MEENHFHDDLFSAGSAVKNKNQSRLKGEYAKQRFLPFLRIPVEYAVIAGIVMLLLVVISYAIGVERGKNIKISNDLVSEDTFNDIVGLPSRKVADIRDPEDILEDDMILVGDGNTDEVIVEEEKVLPVMRETSGPKDVPADEDSVVSGPVKTPEVRVREVKADESKKVVADIGEKDYTVRLITYAKKSGAVSEMEELKKAGYKADFMSVGKWFQVYVSGYNSAEDAKRAQAVLKKRYPDCYIREIK